MAGQWAQLQEGSGDPTVHKRVIKGWACLGIRALGLGTPENSVHSWAQCHSPILLWECLHASHTRVIPHIIFLLCEQFLIFKKNLPKADSA